ncbi:MAG: GntR family transcriptional regulator, sialic acid-inducible nan operon repressor [Mycobacterium sp.]|nr:GntR family transcriptional regulator, sialic acid-inducible nan operon repressor [Mycobacterium sp.]MDT5170322.1 GntR family transcriptional regulator, sialic acid-inducible nan operon repressor [Mycobacterium sp.]MDT5254285.1 GntR family transcriptional regulator, sialic acid-inducible nan operon repressor [Mycobacterium sp.]MDT7736764.1 GntR family transcriptional regulator, sialic acid-inducible nan operon repressor [Mycobacterium sp.]
MPPRNFVPMGAQRSARPLKMSDQVAAQIRRMIARGELVDGDWLPTEAQLIQQFGVSRPTLREAFRLLEGDSLVTIRRGPPGGARVTIPGPGAAAGLFGMVLMLSGTHLGDVWDARLTIEPAAVRQLAETATDAQLAALDEELERVRAVADNDPLSFNRAGVRFHVKLVDLSGNQTLTAVIGMLSEIIERELANALVEIGTDTDEIRRANRRALRGYEKVAALIHAADGAGAERAWREHMSNVRRYVGRTQRDDRVLDALY